MIAQIAALLVALTATGANARIGRMGKLFWLGEGFVLRTGRRPSSSPRTGAPDLRQLLRSRWLRPADSVGQALPSQDGDYWIFYRDDGASGQSGVYCFFVPMAF
jgi:hypothetical protein